MTWRGWMRGGALIVCLLGCSSEPPCPEGARPAAWSQPPLAALVRDGVHVCQTNASDTHLEVWVDSSVHDANMDTVDRIQGADWSRTSDNWYGTSGDFDSPKWSRFVGPGGELRVDIREADDGGALVIYELTPGESAGLTDLERVQRAMAATAERPSAPRANPVTADAPLDAPLSVPETAGRRGSADATVVVHAFLDYESPFDARIFPSLERLADEEGVLVVIRNRPLGFHAHAELAARAALAVRAQAGDEGFWRYQALMFENRTALDRAALIRYAGQIDGVDAARFESDLDSANLRAAVQADVAAAEQAGARGTPTTFIGTQRVAGAVPYERLREAVQNAG